MKQTTFQKIIFILFTGLVVLIPAVFSIEFKSIFAASKLLTLHLFTSAIVLLAGYYIATNKKAKFNNSKWLKYLLVYLVITFLTAIFSINIYSSFFGVEGRFIGTFTMLNLTLLAFVFVGFFPKKKLPIFISFMWLTAVLVAIYAINQYYGLIKFETIRWTQLPSRRAFGTLGHPNHLGAYLATAIVVGIGLIGFFKTYWQRIILVVGTLILLVGLTFTASRGAVFALILTLLFVAILLVRINKKSLLKTSATILFLMILAGSIGIYYKDDLQKISIIQRTLVTTDFVKDGNMIDRISWWKSSMEIIKDNPVLGSGFSTYKDIYNKYRRTDYRVPGDIQDQITPESAHNELINTWATEGSLGLLAYIIMILYALWILLKKIWEKAGDKREKYLGVSIIGALSVYILQTQISFGVISTMTVFYLFMSAAILIGGKENLKEIKLNKYIIIFIVIAFSVSSIYLTNKRIQSEYFIQKAESSILSTDKEKYYEKAILSFPWEYTYHTAYADYTMDAIIAMPENIDFEKYIALATNHYEKALKLNDNHPVDLGNYAIALLTNANYKKSIGEIKGFEAFKNKGFEAFEASTKKGPNNPVFHYHYAKALEALEINEKARDEYAKVLEIRGDYLDAASKVKQLKNTTSPSTLYFSN